MPAQTIAVVSNDLQRVTGKTGRATRFLIFEVDAQGQVAGPHTLELAAEQPSLHDLHDDHTTPHPLDGMVLIAAEAGEGFTARMRKRGVQVHISAETDARRAVAALLAGTLPTRAETPHEEGGCGDH